MVRCLENNGVSALRGHIDAKLQEFVMGSKVAVSGEEELQLRRQFDEAQAAALRDRGCYEFARAALQDVIEGRFGRVTPEAHGQPKVRPPKKDLAEERRVAVEVEFRKRGLAIAVPKPMVRGIAVSNREFDRRSKLQIPQGLFYRPGKHEATYEQIMAAFGQGDHWTVTDEAERTKIGWEPAETGYWFWAEIPAACPRLKTSWNDLMEAVRLLSLEEYAILWHLHTALTGERLDVYTWCWLRTRYKTAAGSGALHTSECGGRVIVDGDGPEFLSDHDDFGGGRAAEAI